MGEDKALIVIDGVALVALVAERCRRAGCERVVAVGGDHAALQAVGLDVVDDRHPGAGPLGGIITALTEAAPDQLVFVVAVDLPGVEATDISRTLTALDTRPDADLAVPLTADGRRHHLHAAWRPRALRTLEAAFEAGERAPRRALGGLTIVDVAAIGAAGLTDVDTPEDLQRWQRDRGIRGPDR